MDIFEWTAPTCKVASETEIFPNWINNETVSSIKGGNASHIRTNAGRIFENNSILHDAGKANEKKKLIILFDKFNNAILWITFINVITR